MNPKTLEEELNVMCNRLFRHSIGDVVCRRKDMERWRLDLALNEGMRDRVLVSTPPLLIVLARHIERCYGGIQIRYGLGGFPAGEAPFAGLMFEFELVGLVELDDALSSPLAEREGE